MAHKLSAISIKNRLFRGTNASKEEEVLTLAELRKLRARVDKAIEILEGLNK